MASTILPAAPALSAQSAMAHDDEPGARQCDRVAAGVADGPLGAGGPGP